MAITQTWVDGEVVARDYPLADVSEQLADDGRVVWIDLFRPTRDEVLTVAAELGLHELAVEDALHPHQRPKLDHYPDHLFLAVYVPYLDLARGTLDACEVDVFVMAGAFVTVRNHERADMDPVVRRWSEQARLGRHGVGWMLHTLLDHIVDTHFDTVRELDDALDALEDNLFDPAATGREVQRRAYELRKSLVALRRVVLPMREVVAPLLRRESPLVDEAMLPYMQDVYDHVLRASEWTESLRDLAMNMMETHLTIQGNRLNEIMKKLTAWAAIIAVPTAVTGFYGQNVPYPGFARHVGFVQSTVIIVVLVAWLVVLFRRKNWL